MSADSFAELTGFSGLSVDIFKFGAGSLMQYSDSGVWDSTGKKFYLLGGSHTTDVTPNQAFWSWDDATNAWVKLTDQAWYGGIINGVFHAYDGMAVNPATGIIYYRQGQYGPLRQYAIGTATWSTITDPPNLDINYTAAIAYYPEMSGLLYLNHGYLHLWNGSAWSQITSGLATNENHVIAEYNSATGKVLLGGGNNHTTTAYILDSAGNCPAAPGTLPCAIGCGPNQARVCVDPGTGKFLFYLCSGTALWDVFYAYDGATGTSVDKSSKLLAAMKLDGNYSGYFSAPISTYSVTLYVTNNYGGTPRMFVYKGI
jgi:hypothetical protein